jgi:hypothetical protein
VITVINHLFRDGFLQKDIGASPLSIHLELSVVLFNLWQAQIVHENLGLRVHKLILSALISCLQRFGHSQTIFGLVSQEC